MTAKIIDGVAISKKLRTDYANRVAQLKAKGITPGLAVVIVGHNPASQVYVRNKHKACQDIGMHSEVHELSEHATEAMLLQFVEGLNNNPAIHGILVQLPLPSHIDEQKILELIKPEKDVDGFHPYNVGRLMIGEPTLRSCTPYGVMKMFEYENIKLEGKEAVVVGRSNIVGKPMALMLMAEGATVTICHSKTRDLAAHTRRADIVVAAVGKLNMLRADMVKPGAVVIDVGMNRTPEGKLAGDVDYANVKEVAGYITPVPGGVGPMTITMLLGNTLEAAERLVASN
ncbi:MAG: bifunctional methylenetetrahydrofolate dehydrogenase/methenyltetrahydrofolate cyclohydrolase FolD [Burkholderiales bacterium]